MVRRFRIHKTPKVTIYKWARNINLVITDLVQSMKRAVAKCPKVGITIMGENMPLLLDCDSMVSLMWQTYFNRYFRPQLGPAEGAVVEAHNLFDLKSANGEGIPLSRYVKLDL